MIGSSQAIAVNMLILWARIAATMAATVFSTRFALSALGVDTFGVYVAIASLPLMLGFLTGAMGVITVRMLATGLAKQPTQGQRIFNASLGSHIAVAFLIVIVGETFGIWLLENALSIPDELVGSARTILRISVAGVAIGAILAPYEALLQARERFGLFAMLDIIRSLTVLIGTWSLLTYSGDRLVGYAIVQASASVGVLLIGSLIASWKYPEGRLRPLQMIDRSDLHQRLGLVSWTVFGSLAMTSRIHGFVVLANVLFGPSASAVLGVGNQVIGLLRQLSTAVSQVITPKIYVTEAAGERSRMISLALLACKYSSFIGVLFSVPLIIELPMVLELWLGAPLLGASTPITFMIIAFLLDQLSSSMGGAYFAIGRVALYQLVCGLTFITALPLAYFIAEIGGDLSGALCAVILTSGLVAVLRLFLLEPISPSVFKSWMVVTIVPVIFGLGSSLFVGLVVTSMFDSGVGRMIVAVIASSLALLSVVFIDLDTLERKAFEKMVSQRWIRCIDR